jgi:hypothetical protein
MTWFEQLREDLNKQTQRRQARSGPTPVDGVCGIPCEATPEERFRLTAAVERVYERTTKDGNPCYFLHCRDTAGIQFCVVCWDWQWARLQGRAEEGKSLSLDLRVPREGFSAFSLA